MLIFISIYFGGGHASYCEFYLNPYRCELYDVNIISEDDVFLIDYESHEHQEGFGDEDVVELSSLSQTMAVIHKGIFERFPNIASLRLDRMNKEAITEDSLEFCIELRVLAILHNSINRILAGAFKFCNSLESLDLSSDKIQTIEDWAFVSLGNVKFLNLASNTLAQLSESVFYGMSSLVTLDLSNNRLIALVPGVFRGLGNLESLNLATNQIANIAPGAFESLANLIVLTLSNNQISGIIRNIFAGLEKVQTIDLGSNNLEEFDVDASFGIIGLVEKRHQLSSYLVEFFEKSDPGFQQNLVISSSWIFFAKFGIAATNFQQHRRTRKRVV